MRTSKKVIDLTQLEKENIALYKERVENQNATLLIIDGSLGLGKTTFAIRLLEEYQHKIIDYEKQLAFGGDEFINKLLLCYKAGYKAIIYDEAGDFNKKATLTQFNRSLNRVFDIYRAFQILVIVVLPSAQVLDNGLYNKGVVRALYHLYEKTKNYTKYKAFDIDRIGYIKYNFYKYRHAPWLAYKYVYANYRGHFKNLPPERSKELDKISTDQKIAFMEAEADKINKKEIKEEKQIKKDDNLEKIRNNIQNKILVGIK